MSEPSFTEKFMSGGKSIHVESLSQDFNSRRIVGWALLIVALGIQIAVAIWMSVDLSSMQNDMTSVSNYIANNKSSPSLGQSQCSLDAAFNSPAAPNLSSALSNTRTASMQRKTLLIVMAGVLAIFGFIALTPNPFIMPNHAALAPSTTYVV